LPELAATVPVSWAIAEKSGLLNESAVRFTTGPAPLGAVVAVLPPHAATTATIATAARNLFWAFT
jgi:hypothetical protein